MTFLCLSASRIWISCSTYLILSLSFFKNSSFNIFRAIFFYGFLIDWHKYTLEVFPSPRPLVTSQSLLNIENSLFFSFVGTRFSCKEGSSADCNTFLLAGETSGEATIFLLEVMGALTTGPFLGVITIYSIGNFSMISNTL